MTARRACIVQREDAPPLGDGRRFNSVGRIHIPQSIPSGMLLLYNKFSGNASTYNSDTTCFTMTAQKRKPRAYDAFMHNDQHPVNRF